MSSDIAARRREARVKKILGNLEGRLQRISGNTTFSDHDLNHDNKILNSFSFDTVQNVIEESIAQPKPKTVDEILQRQPEVSAVKTEQTAVERLACNHLIHVILVAVMALIILQANAGYLIYESVMVPFYTLEFGKMAMGRRNLDSSPSIVFSLLSIYASRSKVTLTILEIFSLVAATSRDLCVYLFIVILFSAVFGLG